MPPSDIKRPNILSGTAPGFDQPLELLAACHERILGFCLRLEQVVIRLEAGQNDDEVADACAAIVRYFSTAAPHHHADEDVDLFPLLCERDPALATAIAALSEEHQQLEDDWRQLEVMLAEPAHLNEALELEAIASGFIATYREHVEIENRDIFPRAAQLLNEEEQRALGHNMARRRGVTV